MGIHNVDFGLGTINGISFNNPQSFTSTPTGNSHKIYTRVFTISGDI